MKKLLLLLLASFIFIQCDKSLSVSDTPAIIIVDRIVQDSRDKENQVCQYKLSVYSDGLYTGEWYTLKEGFNVGDTLIFIKR